VLCEFDCRAWRPKEGETLVTEATEWNPELAHSDYAISKYGAEMEVWRGWQEGLAVAIVNPV
jgi:nucleoside-diphosphate-sugar epimerase